MFVVDLHVFFIDPIWVALFASVDCYNEKRLGDRTTVLEMDILVDYFEDSLV